MNKNNAENIANEILTSIEVLEEDLRFMVIELLLKRFKADRRNTLCSECWCPEDSIYDQLDNE